MHELSVALEIVEIAEKEASGAGAQEVKVIELEIGDIAGIQMDSFDFAWPMAVRGTLLENAERRIRRIKAEAVCLECGERFGLDNIYDGCPHCSSFFKDILHGKELRIKSLEVA